MKAKQEEEKRHLEERRKSELEQQRRQMKDMMKAKVGELQREQQSVVAQNESLQQSIDEMQRSLYERNSEIEGLQGYIQAIANQPTEGPCVII